MAVKVNNICEGFKTYKDVLNAINKTYGKAGIDAYELCLKLYEEETGVNAHNLKGKLVFTTDRRGPVSAASVANITPATYIKMIESGEISALKSLMKYYYNMIGDPTLNVNKLKQESLNKKVKTIKERTEKGSLSTMLNAFENKINEFDEEFDESIRKRLPRWQEDDVGFDIPWDEEGFDIPEDEFEEFDESLDEAREMHTWNITYIGKGNKARNHIVDAPDAYEANRKARRELGISYTDIDDVTMVENKKMNEDTDISDVRMRTEDYLGELLSMRFEDWFTDIYSELGPDYMAKKIKDYNPEWARIDEDAEDERRLEDLYDKVLTELISYISDQLFYNE